MTKNQHMTALKEVLSPVQRSFPAVPGETYRQIGVKLWGQGAYEREPIDGAETKYKSLNQVAENDIIINKIWARNGSVGVVPGNLAGCFASGEFPTFVPDRSRLEPMWFHWLARTPTFWQKCDEKSRGTSGKNRIRPEKFLEITIPLPSLEKQKQIIQLLSKVDDLVQVHVALQDDFEGLIQSILDRAFKGAFQSPE